MKFRYPLATLFLLFPALTMLATTRKVLFIGNSYTYTNNMPLMLQTLATALGDTLVYGQSDPGGYTLEEHSAYAPTLSLIFSQQWDIVVLQEQSELPSFPPAQVDTQVYPYAHILDSMIHANDSCTQTMFMMTWGHADGDPANCPGYPVICTYDGMQQRLRESYLQMTQDNSAIVAPVGAAWKVMRDSFPTVWLYQSDSDHPDIQGSYLETCVLYSSIFHKKTYNTTYTGGLSATDANTIQRIADKVTLDSIMQWQQYGHYPYAGFSAAVAGATATFSATPTITAQYSWQFGDGGADTSADPVHSYVADGSYIVKHTAETHCFSETISDTIHVATTGLGTALKGNNGRVSIAAHGGGYVTFTFSGNQQYSEMDVFDAGGRSVRKYMPDGNTVTINDHFTPGFYTLKTNMAENRACEFYKFIVY
jgi:PKD repeat protein